MNANIQLIITSAGIAALVSGGLNFVSNWLERKERRKELLFKTAIDMAKLRIDRLLELADRQKAHVSLRDDLNLAGDYRQMLEHFYEKGKLPLEVIEAEKRSETELKKKKEALIERSKKKM